MMLNEYQKGALKTAVYPRVGTGEVVYPSLGLAGEAGEVANKVKKVLRDYGGHLTPEMKSAILQELGDCLWYIAQISSEMAVDLDEVAKMNLDKLQSRSEREQLRGSGDGR